MPPRKRSVILSPRAQEDREHIYRHGIEMWEENQANDYVEELFRALDTLAAFPGTGKERDDPRPGLRTSEPPGWCTGGVLPDSTRLHLD